MCLKNDKNIVISLSIMTEETVSESGKKYVIVGPVWVSFVKESPFSIQPGSLSRYTRMVVARWI